MVKPNKVWTRHPKGRPAVVAFRLPEAERDALDEATLRTGLTTSELVRQALRAAGLIGEAGR